jgi:glutathione S-transferase
LSKSECRWCTNATAQLVQTASRALRGLGPAGKLEEVLQFARRLQLPFFDVEALAETEYVAGNTYTIADMAIWPWYGGLAKGWLYGAAEFLSVQDYKNIQRCIAAGNGACAIDGTVRDPARLREAASTLIGQLRRPTDEDQFDVQNLIARAQHEDAAVR